ncbi:MAG: tail fiber domain-containing protein [Devosia sp.]
MRRLLTTTALVAILPFGYSLAGSPPPPSVPPSGTEPSIGLMLGIAAEFGDSGPDVGVTAKVLSTNHSNNFVVGGGISWFPTSTDQPIGLDLSAGLNLTNFTILGGYDFLRQAPQISAGYVPTTDGLYCPPGYTLTGGTCVADSQPSDRRLKRDITHVATLNDGIRLYAFRYLWSEDIHVGVMAQDLLEDRRFARTVTTGKDGFYQVDYSMLDLRMVSYDEWTAWGVDAVVLGSRPAKLWIEQAA